MKTTLNTLSIGQEFKLDTKRSFLKYHTYVLISNTNGEFVYILKNDTKHNQKTTTKIGLTKVIVN